jgi:hypothetical protein
VEGAARGSRSRFAVEARGRGSRSRFAVRDGGRGSLFAVAVVVAVAIALGGCGYRPLYGSASSPGAQGQGEERFSVTGISPLVADASVVAEVEAGVRAGLARAALLRGGGGYPRIVVEVLRFDTQSEGIAAVPGGVRTDEIGGVPVGAPAPLLPLARGTRVGIVARAWLERTPGAPKERETGDLRAVDVMQVESDARLETLRMDDASRAAARRLGERLARRVLGEPDAPDDGM